MKKVFISLKVFEQEDDEDSDDVILSIQEEMSNIQKYTRGKLGFQKGKDDDVSDDEYDDRGYSYNRL